MARLVDILTILCIYVTIANSNCLKPHHDGPLYRVLLDNCGPEPKIDPPIEAPHVITPEIHQPLKKLPHAPIPAPKVISHKVIHVKTILKPQVFQRVITVPKVYKFLKKTVAPVIEHIPYKAKPILHEIPAPPILLPSTHLHTSAHHLPNAPCDSAVPNLPHPEIEFAPHPHHHRFSSCLKKPKRYPDLPPCLF